MKAILLKDIICIIIGLIAFAYFWYATGWDIALALFAMLTSQNLLRVRMKKL